VKNDSESRMAIRFGLIRTGWTFVIVGMSYTIGGLVGLVPLELGSGILTNIRIPAGLAVLGCLICVFAYGEE
jgi:VIT1/CCC1 family predicted Fe2+/Mn2+ transporter